MTQAAEYVPDELYEMGSLPVGGGTTLDVVAADCPEIEALALLLAREIQDDEVLGDGGRRLAGPPLTRLMAVQTALRAIRYNCDIYAVTSVDAMLAVASRSLRGWGKGRDRMAGYLAQHVEMDRHRALPCGCGRH